MTQIFSVPVKKIIDGLFPPGLPEGEPTDVACAIWHW